IDDVSDDGLHHFRQPGDPERSRRALFGRSVRDLPLGGDRFADNGVDRELPVALAPGMGLNAYFTYTVVKTMGYDWRIALGAVFISGVAFLILTLARIRALIVDAIPMTMKTAVAAGIGLFIAFIGLKNAGVIAAAPATFVTLGHITAKPALLALGGLV